MGLRRILNRECAARRSKKNIRDYNVYWYQDQKLIIY